MNHALNNRCPLSSMSVAVCFLVCVRARASFAHLSNDTGPKYMAHEQRTRLNSSRDYFLWLIHRLKLWHQRLFAHFIYLYIIFTILHRSLNVLFVTRICLRAISPLSINNLSFILFGRSCDSIRWCALVSFFSGRNTMQDRAAINWQLRLLGEISIEIMAHQTRQKSDRPFHRLWRENPNERWDLNWEHILATPRKSNKWQRLEEKETDKKQNEMNSCDWNIFSVR